MDDFIGSVLGIGMLVLLFLGGKAVYQHFTEPDYSKPWWTGTQTERVCDTETDMCYSLSVTSNGDGVTGISFPNGGYLYGSSTCHKAADGLYDFDRFCRLWDQEGRKWDIEPLFNE